MKKVLLSALMIIAAAPIATANVYYSTPPTVYVRPDPSYQTGQAIGNLLGALIQSSNQQASQQKQQKLIEDTRIQIKDIADSEAKNMKIMIENGQAEEMMSQLENFIYSQEMSSPVKKHEGGIFSISYIKDIGSGVKMYREYAVNTNTDQCRCLIKISPFNIQEAGVETLIIDRTPQRQVTLTEAVGQYLGIITSTQKTHDGGFEILDVIPGGISEFAGVKKGDVLVKIDTYDLTEHDIDRVAAYIALRYKQKQIIRATVLRNNTRQVVEIQL